MGSGKKVLSPYVLVNNQSLAASFTSNPTSIEYMDRCCLEIICTGTMTGTVTVQGSVDYLEPNRVLVPQASPANWHDLPLSLNALVGVDQTYVVDMQMTALRFIRINFVRTGGAGNMTVIISAKES